MKKIKITEEQLKFLMENKDKETVVEIKVIEEKSIVKEVPVVSEEIQKIKANFKRFI